MPTELLRPNARGDYQEWEILVDSSHWGATSDQNDATYIETQTVMVYIDIQHLEDPTFSPGDTINSVTYYFRAYSEGKGGPERLKYYGKTGFDGGFFGNEPITRNSWNEYNSGPQTTTPLGLAWTYAKITNLQAGIWTDRIDAGDLIRVSEIWVVIDYTEAPPSALIRRKLIGVGK